MSPEIAPDLLRRLKRLRLGGLMPTLPDRAAHARQAKLGHLEFLELLLQDEIDIKGVSAEVEAIIIGANIIAILSGILARKKSQRVVQLAKGITESDRKIKEADRELDRLKDKPNPTKAEVERASQKVRRAREELQEDRRAVRRIAPQAQI